MLFSKLALTIPGILFALTIHEFAHALAANSMGDPTAKNSGRLTLNPFPHIDIVGLISLLLFRFGWAKPVPINPLLMRKPKTGIFLVSLSGPFSNLVFGFILGIITRIYSKGAIIQPNENVMFMLSFAIIINIILAFFNLIPIPPLDGSKILFTLLDIPLEKQFLLEKTGPVLLILIIVTSNLVGFNILWAFLSKPVLFFSKLFLGFTNGGI